MSFVRELDFIEQTKYGSSTLKEEEKLPKAQLRVLLTRIKLCFRRRAKLHKMDVWEVAVILDQIEILTQKQKERRYNFTSFPRTNELCSRRRTKHCSKLRFRRRAKQGHKNLRSLDSGRIWAIL